VMRRAFTAKVGVLPSLLLCLRLIGESVSSVRVGAVHRASGGGGALVRSLTITTGRGKVDYVSLFFRLEVGEHTHAGRQDWPSVTKWSRGSNFVNVELAAIRAAIDSVPVIARTSGGGGGGVDGGAAGNNGGIEGGVGRDIGVAEGVVAPRRLFVAIFKAAPHWILRTEWMANWVLGTSAATLQDETGLRPRSYENASLSEHGGAWTVSRFGRFAQFENREIKWYPGEKGELERAFPGPELRFRFGYAQAPGNNGVLQTAWRSSLTVLAP